MDWQSRVEAYLNEIKIGLIAVVVLLMLITYALFTR